MRNIRCIYMKYKVSLKSSLKCDLGKNYAWISKACTSKETHLLILFPLIFFEIALYRVCKLEIKAF